MHSIGLFVEDFGHEMFIRPLLARMATERGLAVSIRTLAATGGYSRMIAELEQYVTELSNHDVEMHDALVVATDTNCAGLNARRRQVTDAVGNLPIPWIAALPDPHIERWMLIDSAAFKSAFGTGCAAPDHKCERDRYKKILRESLKEVGIAPSLGGMEFADDVVKHLDLGRAPTLDSSIASFVGDATTLLNSWDQRLTVEST
jgi:hypothetical protein